MSYTLTKLFQSKWHLISDAIETQTVPTVETWSEGSSKLKRVTDIQHKLINDHQSSTEGWINWSAANGHVMRKCKRGWLAMFSPDFHLHMSWKCTRWKLNAEITAMCRDWMIDSWQVNKNRRTRFFLPSPHTRTCASSTCGSKECQNELLWPSRTVLRLQYVRKAWF